jgi:hypothetical protein
VNKAYEVRQDGWTLDGGILLTLRETDSSVFDMDAEFTTADPAPNTRLPDPWSVAPITGLAAASGTTHLLQQADGTVVTRVSVTWDAVDDPRVIEPTGGVEIDWRTAGSDNWQTVRLPGDRVQWYLIGPKDGTVILIRARAIGAVGKSVDCTQITHNVVGKSDAPANATGLAATAIAGAIRIAWDECTEGDYAVSEVRYGSSWGAGTRIFRGRADTYDWAWPADGTYTLRLRHENFSGVLSVTSDTLSVTVDEGILITTGGLADGAATEVFQATDTSVISAGNLAPITYTADADCEVVVTARASCEGDSTPTADYNPRIGFGPSVETTGGTLLLSGLRTNRYLLRDGVDFQAALYQRIIYTMAAGDTAVFYVNFAGDHITNPIDFYTFGTTYCEIEVIKK